MNTGEDDILAGVSSLNELLDKLAAVESARFPEILWKRCALVRDFDEPLYAVLIEDLQCPAFSDFTKASDVEPVAPDASRFALRENARKKYLALWQREDPALADFSNRLLAYYRAQNDTLESFVHLLLANPGEAKQQFDTMYREADAAFNLSQCDGLLCLLRQRYPLLSGELQDTLNDREPYLQSRSIFVEDFYRTVCYLEREELSHRSLILETCLKIWKFSLQRENDVEV